MQPIGAKVPRIHRVRVRFGEPVDPKLFAGSSPGQARRQLTDEVMDRIAALSAQLRASTYNERPPDG